ncbi:MAG: transglycosylase domain-containing protein [Desulfobacterales bacterium]|nr:transglycosylase domain-containing protein [Desulfobacterales bacterium]
MAAGTYKKWGIAGLTVLVLTVSIVGLDKKYPLNLDGKAWSTLVTGRDGTPLRAFADTTGVWRYPAGLSDISPLYLKALMTYEDRWFYFHPGVNPVSFIRAAVQNLISGRIISGGSTLTMQVARLLHPGPRTLLGKGYQILRALQLEYHLTKDQILSLYINLAPFGSNIEGVRTASYTYLGKPATELSHAEAALLAVLPQAPSFYRPDRHPERAKKARDKVLERMDRFRAWEKEVITAARQEPVIALRYAAPMIAPLAARRLARNRQDQTKIVSSLDPDLQIHLEQIVKDYVSGLSDDQSGAVLVVNYKTLDVLAYIGSADFSSARRKGHVDMVRALRAPGSALKPFLYGLALDEGLIHSQSLLLDTPGTNRTMIRVISHQDLADR